MSPVTAETRVEWSTRLAQALVQGGYETESNLAPLLAESRATGQTLASLLISRKLALPGVVVGALAHLAQLPAIDLGAMSPSPGAASALPQDVALEYEAVALQFDGSVLTVGFGEPPSSADLEAMSSKIGYRINPVLADPVLIAQSLNIGDGQAPAAGRMADPPTAANGSASQGSEAPSEQGSLEHGIQAVATNGTMALHIDDLLRYAVSVGASDLHLTANMPGSIRVHGAIRPIEGCPVLNNETLRDMVFGILPGSQRERFEAENELDTSHSIAGVGRFRVNVSLQRGTVAAALRPIPHQMPEFDSLGLPDSIRSFTDLRKGLVLVTGPTGSGKSTTLASLIDIINRTKPHAHRDGRGPDRVPP